MGSPELNRFVSRGGGVLGMAASTGAPFGARGGGVWVPLGEFMGVGSSVDSDSRLFGWTVERSLGPSRVKVPEGANSDGYIAHVGALDRPPLEILALALLDGAAAVALNPPSR